MVPEGWKKERLKKVAELQRGFDLPSAKRIAGGYPIISSGGVSGRHNEAKVKAPGVVTGRYGSVGEVFFVKEDFWPLNTSLWVKDFHGNYPKYIYYLLSKVDYNKFSDKTGVPGVNRNDLHAISVPVPPLPEQQKIARTLSTWDEAITTTERLIEVSQQQKRALMQQLLSGKRRLPGFQSSAEHHSTKYGEIPSDWDFASIGKIARPVVKKNAEGHDLPVLSCSKYDGFVDSLKYFKKKVYSDDTSTYKIINREEFGFPANHIEEGSIGRQNLYDKGLVSPIYVVFKLKKDRIDGEFLYSLLKTEHYRQIFASSTNASVDRRGSLRWQEFSAIKVQLPPLDEQQAIASVLSSADNEIEAFQQKLECLRQEKKALMQQLLTGKRRVKVEEKEDAIA